MSARNLLREAGHGDFTKVADASFDEKEKEWIRYLAKVMDVDFKI